MYHPKEITLIIRNPIININEVFKLLWEIGECHLKEGLFKYEYKNQSFSGNISLGGCGNWNILCILLVPILNPNLTYLPYFLWFP